MTSIHQETGPVRVRSEVLGLLLPPESITAASLRTTFVRRRAGLPPISAFAYLFAFCSLLLHFFGRNQYGFFRDELYYIACGRHLAFGYIDQPPLVAVIARLSSLWSGDAPAGFRLLPAAAGACLVLLTVLITRELGGGRFAQALAGVTVLLSPVHLAFSSFLSMNAFEALFWAACAYLLIRIVKGGDERLWLAFGVVAGLGLQNKHTMLVFGFAVVAALLLGGNRTCLRSRYVWLGGLTAFVIFLPNLIWEARHGWPQIEVVRNCQNLKNVPVGPLRFLWEQVVFVNPIAFPVVAAGLAWLVWSRRGKRFRSLGLAWLIVMAVVMMLRGKSYYVTPFYPILMGAGGVGAGGFLMRSRTWLRATYMALLVVSGLAAAPFSVPILSPEAFLRYEKVIALGQAVKAERDSPGQMHQLYADMFGWDSMAATIARVYHSLPESDQRKCTILAGNYGEAGAVDLLGAKYGLPRALSGHNNYYLWGGTGQTGEVTILFGQNAESEKGMFRSVEQVAIISSRYAVTAENHLPVYVCRNPRVPLTQLWPTLRYLE